MNSIYNPETKQSYSIFSKNGKVTLKLFIQNFLKGGNKLEKSCRSFQKKDASGNCVNRNPCKKDKDCNKETEYCKHFKKKIKICNKKPLNTNKQYLPYK